MQFVTNQRVKVPIDSRNPHSEKVSGRVADIEPIVANDKVVGHIYKVEILEGAFQFQIAQYVPNQMEDASERITFEQWALGSVEQRFGWLETRALLDTRANEVSRWMELFNDHGARITLEQAVGVWLQLTQGRPVWRTDTADNC